MVRTLVNGQVVEKAPKTGAGKRMLPLDDTLAAQLKAFKALQAREKIAAGRPMTVLLTTFSVTNWAHPTSRPNSGAPGTG